MKSLLFLLCCLNAIVAQNFELRPNHVVVHSGQGLEAHVSHLPDESNFQASGGAALGSFGGLTRVIVLLVVFLGVLYHGFVPAAIFGSEATVRPAPATLPVRKVTAPPAEESVQALVTQPIVPAVVEVPVVVVSAEIRAEVAQKVSKQAAKKLAKKAAKKLLEVAKPIEIPVETVVVDKKKKNKEKPVIKENELIVEPVEAAKEKEVVVEEQPIVEEKESVVEEIATPSAIVAEVELEQEEGENVVAEGEIFDEREVAVEEELVVEQERVEEERQDEFVQKSGWVENPPKPFERTSVTIKRARRLMSIHSLLSVRQARQPADILDDLDLGSFVVDPRTVNCPDFMKAAPPLLLEESSPLDIAEQDTPTSIEPVRDKIVSPPMVQEFVPTNKIPEPAPINKTDSPRDWTFNSHKKSAWMQRQTRAAWPNDVALPEFMSFGLPWSPIRTPCKFAAACKKPGCQFTHPANTVPAWLSQAY